ncbi:MULTISPECIES: hypothetical protein [unclassified Acidovorax]|uniref:hypothetical protein n=1 Tax=unclassified Acidovorax TaxID=2684926 RepID=UPI0019813539|nr:MULTISPECIES: hypothetical protein [unclassified Acidovorax]
MHDHPRSHGMTAEQPGPRAHDTAVLLLHGLCSTSDELLSVQHALRAAGCAVCAPRIAG